MRLRDAYGEVEVGIGDLFEHEGALLSVICPETSLCHVILVRLKSGVIRHDGQEIGALTDGPVSPCGFPLQPVFRFKADLVASCVRAYRLQEPGLPAPVAQQPAQSVTKRSSARPGKKDAPQPVPPDSNSLF